MNYKTIKALAKSQGVSVNDLLAMPAQSDPFYCGMPAQIRNAEWFADLWKRFRYTDGVHLRRLHYQIVSQREDVKLPFTLSWDDNKYSTDIYLNNEKCWDFLCKAGKDARYMHRVEVGAFVDRRNPDAVLNIEWMEEAGAIVDFDHELQSDFTGFEFPEMPEFPYFDFSQDVFNVDAYHVELWCEKSTMNDILKPLCREHRANLVTGLGDLSITAVWNLLKRAQNSGRPVRIFYVSDLDGKGHDMPIGVARKIEFLMDRFKCENVNLEKVVLTSEQVKEYSLPGEPMKSGDSTKRRFEAIHGEAVELDALESLHPGELYKILNARMFPYTQANVEDEIDQRFDAYKAALRQEASEALAPFQDAYSKLMPWYSKLMNEFKPQFIELIAEWEELHQEAEAALEKIEVDPRDFLEGLEDDLEGKRFPEAPMLFESERPYFPQLYVYKRYKANEK